ncbi:MAG: phosphodiester glycosidase family protein [Candidatus Sumerlaeota bacterium]
MKFRNYRIIFLSLLLLILVSGAVYYYLPLRTSPEGLRIGLEKIAAADWDRRTVAPGLEHLHYHFFHLFASPQNVNILRVAPSEPTLRMRVVAKDRSTALTSAFAREVGAVAAVNGTMFTRDKKQPLFFARANENAMHPLSEPAWPGKAAFGIDAEGSPFITDKPPQGWSSIDAPDLMVGWPRLLSNGEHTDLDHTHFPWRRHPRTIVGIDTEGAVYFVVIDGRTSGSRGLSLYELQFLARGLGLVDALNLDGGGSSTMWTHEVGIVNRPSDNHRFDHQGERPVHNVWCILSEQ